MIKAADVGETAWELSVQVDQKQGAESMKFKLLVKGDLHIGGLMLKLVEKISKSLKWISCSTVPQQVCLLSHTLFALHFSTPRGHC